MAETSFISMHGKNPKKNLKYLMTDNIESNYSAFGTNALSSLNDALRSCSEFLTDRSKYLLVLLYV